MGGRGSPGSDDEKAEHDYAHYQLPKVWLISHGRFSLRFAHNWCGRVSDTCTLECESVGSERAGEFGLGRVTDGLGLVKEDRRLRGRRRNYSWRSKDLAHRHLSLLRIEGAEE